MKNISTFNAAALLVGVALLFGCDLEQEIANVADDMPLPAITFGVGIKLDIGDGQTAKVYGPDMCETGFEDSDPTDDVPGCTLLSGKKSVEVTIVIDDQDPFKEVWSVTEGVGPSGIGISVSRPNGWIVREPTE